MSNITAKDSSSDPEFPAWILKLSYPPNNPPDLAEWLVKVVTTGMKAPGHVNAEIIPPTASAAPEWTILQRFRTMEQIADWQGSTALHRVLEEIVPLLDQNLLTMAQLQVEHYAPTAHVATAIMTHVKQGKEDEYRDWVAKIHAAQIRAAGYRGTFIQAPAPGSKAPWITLLRFASAESLDKWFESDTRKRLLSEAQHLLRYDLISLTSAFPGWFPTDPSTGESPPRIKTALLVLLALFPIIVIQRQFLLPYLSPLGAAMSVFIPLTVSVALITLVLMPILIKVFNFWLFPTGHNPMRDNLRGYLAIFCLYASMIGLAQLCLPKL
jgi:uncharacterized protein